MKDWSRRRFLISTLLLPAWCARGCGPFAPDDPLRSLDPLGRLHVAIGTPNTVDTLKTFVEAEGSFSPGVGSYGIYFWIYDKTAMRLIAPTLQDVDCQHGLGDGGLLVPWSLWRHAGLAWKSQLCQAQLETPDGALHVVGARVQIGNDSGRLRQIALYAALRPLGPAGWDVNRLETDGAGDLLLVDGRVALLADRRASNAGVLSTDTIGELALSGRMPTAQRSDSPSGDCSGALRFDLDLSDGAMQQLGFICPVLPGRRAARHHWVDRHDESLVDDAPLNVDPNGVPQPDPGAAFFRSLPVSALFDATQRQWSQFLDGANLLTPNPRWGDGMRALLCHLGLCLNEGAPDAAVLNYNAYTRDGVYIANVFQKAGHGELSQQILDYLLRHPFSGRAIPEADAPGQLLYALHQQFLLTRDVEWLRRVYFSAQQLAAMIRYYRTTAGPHFVSFDSLEYGDALPPQLRNPLQPGSCDGIHPEYTEAFDIAGLRCAAELADALDDRAAAEPLRALATELLSQYQQKFGAQLADDYGSYAVLWPCRLYPLDTGAAHDCFAEVGAQSPGGWRYFPLATAHQGLLAGNRLAGYGTIERHLAHEQLRGFYVLDEGGASAGGGWYRARSSWPSASRHGAGLASIAMPHGWALAELWLLMRDAIVFEADERLVLLSGIPPEWFWDSVELRVNRLPTYFGELDLLYRYEESGAQLSLLGAAPPQGYVLRLPPELSPVVLVAEQPLEVLADGSCSLDAATREVRIRYGRVGSASGCT